MPQTQVAFDSLTSSASAASHAITSANSAYRQRKRGWIKTIYAHDFLEVQVKGSGGQPQPWLAAILESIQRLLLLEENWDSYGGRRITSAAARGALEASLWMNNEVSQPWVVPTSKGGLQLEWHGINHANQNVEVEVEVSPDGATTVSCEPETRGDWRDVVKSLRRA
jgi:hypothetical protein